MCNRNITTSMMLTSTQIAAFHQGTTHVRIRLRLEGETDPADPFMFNSVEYKDGEEIDVSLSQYQSLQLQSNQQDLTGRRECLYLALSPAM